MAQRPKDLNPFASARAFLGAELRHWRTQRGLSQAGLGRLTHDSAALIGRFEKAERWPSRDAALRLDEALETSGALTRIWDRTSQEKTQRPAPTGPSDSSSAGGVAAGVVDSGIGLDWDEDISATARTVAALWAADADLEPLPLPWIASVGDGALLRWLLTRDPPVIAEPATSIDSASGAVVAGGVEVGVGARRRVGMADVGAIVTMGDAFATADHQLGGGYARSTLSHFLRTTVRPLLSAPADATVRRQMLTAAARLCDLAGFMSFDSGHHGLAQRYFIQALRLAREVGDEALGAHVLGDMTMQALHLDARVQAIALAEASVDASTRSRSPAVASRANAVASRAYARAADPVAADRAMSAAERLLDAGHSDGDPSWIQFFTTNQLSTEFLYACADLARTSKVEQIAATVLTTPSSTMQRRHVLATAATAAAFLPPPEDGSSLGRGTGADPLRSLDMLRGVLPALAGVSSARGLAAVNEVRGRLLRCVDPEIMRAFEADLHDAML